MKALDRMESIDRGRIADRPDNLSGWRLIERSGDDLVVIQRNASYDEAMAWVERGARP